MVSSKGKIDLRSFFCAQILKVFRRRGQEGVTQADDLIPPFDGILRECTRDAQSDGRM